MVREEKNGIRKNAQYKQEKAKEKTKEKERTKQQIDNSKRCNRY